MTLYLIAHKVRGEPAFDVAIRMETPSGNWWIIPTSGHRAYPYWNVALNVEDNEVWQIPPMPEHLRDHYAMEQAAPRSKVHQLKPAVPTLEDL